MTTSANTLQAGQLIRDLKVLYLTGTQFLENASPNIYFTTISGLAQSVYEDTSEPTAMKTLVTTVVSIINSFVDIVAPADAIQALQPLLNFVASTVSEARSASDTTDQQNAMAFQSLVRGAALMAYARAAAECDFTDRATAVQTRADIAELFDQEILNVTVYADIVDVLTRSRDLACKAISEKIANLAKVVTITAPVSMPSLYWAYRLYADPTRAEELSDRNLTPLPLFMPTTFQALAS